MKLMSIMLFTLLFIRADVARVEKWVIDKRSSICILGKTNINNFRCEIVEYLDPDTLTFYKGEDEAQLITVKGELAININRFDCHEKHITTDLRKTLIADDNAYMKIRLLTLRDVNQKAGGRMMKGSVNIELAGMTRTVDIDFTVQSPQAGTICLTGNRQLAFSDFNLTPPRKLAGLIKVEQRIDVAFRLSLRSIRSIYP